jgi:hypothetical protein
MNTLIAKAAAAGMAFLLIFATGFWLSRMGKPYGVLLFTAHKLIAVGAVIYLAVTIFRMSQTAPIGSSTWAVVAIAAVCAVLTIITGGVASAAAAGDTASPLLGLLPALHRWLPYLTVLASAVMLYLLSSSKGWLYN